MPLAGGELLQTRDVGRRTDPVSELRGHTLFRARGLGRGPGGLGDRERLTRRHTVLRHRNALTDAGSTEGDNQGDNKHGRR